MKVAIKANLSRGAEIISLLESLGGINSRDLIGDGDGGAYYIDENNIIRYNYKSIDYKVYTLEEFEKEFPFKIGETVITTLNHVGTIIGIVNGKYKVMFKEDSALVTPRRLKPYKEIKEERNITLTLDKAKEWYKKGGELREIALQAFTEKEFTKVDLPKTWEEFCKNYPMKEGESYVGASCEIHTMHMRENGRDVRMDRNVYPSEQSAEAHLALIQLEQLRNCWWGDWEPNWLDGNEIKYVIKGRRDKSSIETTYVTHSFLSFPTYEMAKEFLECFKDLIEKAGDLI